MAEKLTIQEAQQVVEGFLHERDWFPKDSDSKYYTLAHMMEELGEVSRCISHLEGKRMQVMDSKKEEMSENLRIELGDVLYHVFKLASAYDIDMSECFHVTMEKNHKKFPIERFGKKK